jgi:hypothetical protein
MPGLPVGQAGTSSSPPYGTARGGQWHASNQLCKTTCEEGAVHIFGMQWRAIGQLCDIPFNTLYGLFARRIRAGLWRGLLDRLRRTRRRAYGDTPEPSVVVIGGRSCRSVPSCFARGIDDGKKIHGVRIQMAVDVTPANRHDTKAIVPVLP